MVCKTKEFKNRSHTKPLPGLEGAEDRKSAKKNNNLGKKTKKKRNRLNAEVKNERKKEEKEIHREDAKKKQKSFSHRFTQIETEVKGEKQGL